MGNPRSLLGLIAACLWPFAACAQDPLVTLPNNYKLAFENSAVMVIRAHYGPHEKIPVHDHTSLSTVFVYLSDSGEVRIDHAEGNAVSAVVRPPTVQGAFRVNAGAAERHSIENLGDTSSDFLRVELKQISLGLTVAFRGKAPASLAQSGDKIEFSEADLQVERIVCVGTSPCVVKPSAAPSLLVAFTPIRIAVGTFAKREPLAAGAVRWLPASQAANLSGDAGSTVHMLRILLPMAGPH